MSASRHRAALARNASSGHVPVMLEEVLDALAPEEGALIVDGTFGAGGYAAAILDHAPCHVLAIDRDPDAVERGRVLAARYPGRLKVVEGCFGDLAQLVAAEGSPAVHGIALDLGVSSYQIDDPRRGFSFQADGPLDMRMGREGPSAADIVNAYDEADLADIVFRYGEEKKSRRVARAIVRARSAAPIATTLQLAEIVVGALGAPGRSASPIHPATRTFQALRIYVNDELGELERGLVAAESVLAEGGRLVVISFHSLEDRLVKTFLRDRSGGAPHRSRHTPPPASPAEGAASPSFRLLHKKALMPSAAEVSRNPRARSARLRAAIRTAAPASRSRERRG